VTAAHDVAGTLRSVASVTSEGYEVVRVATAPAFRVGRGVDGAVVLLTPPESEGNVGAPTRLRRLTVHARTSVAVRTQASEAVTETVGLVELRELSEDLIPAFCGVAATVVDLIGEKPAPGAVRAALNHVVRLFEPRPGRQGSVLGLWGELLTILTASDVQEMVEAWHVEIDDRFDFAAPRFRLEVKTTDSKRRVHDFTLDQLEPVGGARVRIASVMTTATSAGTSLGDFVEELHPLLSGRMDLAMKVWRLLAETLGGDWMPSTTSARWDRVQAEKSLRLFHAEDVPRVRGDLDPAIESVRLRVNCENVPPVAGRISIAF
jgi:hypothetical protein